VGAGLSSANRFGHRAQHAPKIAANTQPRASIALPMFAALVYYFSTSLSCNQKPFGPYTISIHKWQ
jgi:hypothetical protein